MAAAAYGELRQAAARHMRGEPDGHTFQATALVHEVFLRLADQCGKSWRDQGHFLALASTMMRRILVDHARTRRARKRGGERGRVTLDEGLKTDDRPVVDLVALDDALERLACIDPGQAQIVEMRFFGGLTLDDIAAATGMSPRNVDREWACARAWLYRQLDG